MESGKIVTTNREYPNIIVECSGFKFNLNLIQILLRGFCIILEMYWLLMYEVKIICRTKMVRVKFPNGKPIIIYIGKRRVATNVSIYLEKEDVW